MILSGFLPAEETLSRLVFADRTTISGTVKGLDPESKSLKLTSPYLEGEAHFKTDALLDLYLSLKAEIPEVDHHALATIAPHFEHPMQDTIRGLLVGVDDETVTLDTWYAGQLKLQRAMVRGLDIYALSPSLFNGPVSLENWTGEGDSLEGDWEFKNGALVSKSRRPIAREVEIPNRSKLSFRVEWRSYPYFRISFLANSGKQRYPTVGYSLQVQQSYLQLTRRGPGKNQDELLSENTRQLRNQEGADFEIYLDRSPEGTNALFIDGKIVKDWTETDDLEGMGKWLMFATQNDNPIRVSDIAVSVWDGRLPALEEDDTSSEIFKGMAGQRIDLANGDALFGKITEVKDGVTAIETDLGNIAVPVGRLRSFQLHPEGAKDLPEPRMWPRDVRAWFSDGGFVTLRLSSLTGEKIAGYSQVFGDAEFDLSAFSHIEFNIWADDFSEQRGGSSDDW